MTLRIGWATVLLFAGTSAAQPLPQRLATVFDASCADGFMGAVSVQLRGRTVLEAACGPANAEWDVKNTVDTRFRIASVTKSFTAAAVLLLAQERRLSVQDTIGSYIEDLPPAWREATIHQLLTHTSGIPSYTDGPMRRLDRMGATPRELLAVVADKPMQFPHGARMAYNNTGYVLLGLLIEAVSGMKYEQFVETRLFAPLGMRDSGFDNSRRVLPRRAGGYTRRNGALENAEPVEASIPWSAGGFYSTVRDLITWGAALGSDRILSKASASQMFRVYPETALQGMHYGYGIVLAERFGRPLRYHGGGINGFSSVLQIYPRDSLVIAVLSNLEVGAAKVPSWTLGDRLATVALDGK
jgi:D-alanyl-D-alanine carboxypeptidase